jgi:hypothetical protein
MAHSKAIFQYMLVLKLGENGHDYAHIVERITELYP